MAVKNILFKIQADTKNIDAQLKTVTSDINDLKKSIDGVSKSIENLNKKGAAGMNNFGNATKQAASNAINKLNEYQRSSETIPDNIVGYSEEWRNS